MFIWSATRSLVIGTIPSDQIAEPTCYLNILTAPNCCFNSTWHLVSIEKPMPDESFTLQAMAANSNCNRVRLSVRCLDFLTP